MSLRVRVAVVGLCIMLSSLSFVFAKTPGRFSSHFNIFSLYVADSSIFLCTNIGLLKSGDQGKTWKKITEKSWYGVVKIQNKLIVHDSHSMAMSENDGKSWKDIVLPIKPGDSISGWFAYGNTIYIATYSAIYSSNDFIYWSLIGESTAFPMITSLFIKNGIIYFGSRYDRYSLGLFRSLDQGRSWQNFSIAQTGNHPIFDISVDNYFVYVISSDQDGKNAAYIALIHQLGLWELVPNIHPNTVYRYKNIIYLGCDDGVYISQDERISWKKIVNIPGIMQVMVSGEQIYVVDKNNDLYSSSDQGKTWKHIDYALEVSSVIKDSHNILYAATHSGVRISHDQGKTWDNFLLGQRILKVTMDQQNTDIYSITYQTLYRAVGGGKKWDPVFSLAGSDDSLQSIYVNGTQAVIGTEHGIYLAKNNFQDVKRIMDVNYTQSLFGQGERVYLATANAVMKSDNGGKTWKDLGLTQYQDYYFAIYAKDQNIYVGGKGLYVSENEGESWKLISDTANWHVSSITGYKSEMYVVHDGLLVRTDNRGRTWKMVQTPFILYSFFVAPNHDFFAGTQETGLYISHDDGKNWLHLL